MPREGEVYAEIPNSFYQLTHDFLVPSVRRWLVRKQQETRSGRAELLLEDKAATVADPGRFKPLVAGLAPIGDSLIDVLRDRSRDVARSESDRAIAANILTEYASGRPDILTDVLLEGRNPEQQAAVITKLEPLADHAIALLKSELAKRPEDLRTTWKDLPLKNEASPAPEIVTALEAAAGMVSERFALCQTLPLDDFPRIAEALRAVGYRPTSFRPYQVGDTVQVSALWTRDDRQGRTEQGLTEA